MNMNTSEHRSAPDRRIRTIVVVGGGSAGWMSAAALRAATRREECRIVVIESDEIGIVGVGEATLPTLKDFNRFVGIDEDDFVRNSFGTFKLAIEYVNWTRIGHSYFNPLGGLLRGALGSGNTFPILYQYLLKRAVQGQKPNLDEYELCSVAAKSNRFNRPTREIPNFSYAYHFDASFYAKYLRQHAEKLGTERVEGKITDVQLRADDGFIDAVILESGQRIEGDLFIDCSGFRALLAGKALKDPYEDWTHWLPCDRAWAVPCESVTPLRPYTQAIARDAGWQWRIPLQHRIGNGHVFSSKFISEEKAADTLMSNLDGRALDEPRLVRFTTGRRTNAWVKNCVTVGLASGFIEPLESTSIHLIQSSIMSLLDLFPDRRFDPLLISEYNSNMTNLFDRTRDFIILHYHATEREDTEFWRYCKNMSIPNTLAYRMEMFRKNGYIAVKPGDGFASARSWMTVMYNQGITPEAYHPLVDTLLGGHEMDSELEKTRFNIESAIRQMPLHEDFIARNCSAMAAGAADRDESVAQQAPGMWSASLSIPARVP